MTAVYIASRYTRLAEMQRYKALLDAMGHEVTARWLLGEHQWGGAAVEVARAYEEGQDPPEAVRFALDDVEDLMRADVVISFTEPPRPEVLTYDQVLGAMTDYPRRTSQAEELAWLTARLNADAARISRGGRHVEFGMALALAKRCIVIGPRENVFHLLPQVEQYDSWEQYLAMGVEWL